MSRAAAILIIVTVLVAAALIPISAYLQEQEILDLRMSLAWEERRIPLCSEDVVLVGLGQFEAGQWRAYECGPSFDDYDK